MTIIKYVPAILFAAISAICFLMSMAGDNVDARALAGMMLIPALVFLFLALAALLLAWSF